MKPAAPGPDPRRLYREIVEVEKQLRELLRSNPLNAQDANAMRSRLVDSARALAQASPTFAAQRELEQVLWKPCFYKRIEDFRRRIRKYAAAPASDRSVREHFARVSHEFQEFLSDAASFYESLRAAFTKWLLQHRVARIASANAPPAGETQLNIDKCRTSLHRCLIFLGDLARYRELHSQKAKKNFGAAEAFYHKALAVIPENGNPHNQLAVLATYVEAETVAVYRYCRSLLIAQPFATAEENLALLFERSRQRPLAPPTTAAVTASTNSKDKAAYLKSFLHRLTRMHGVLFSLASSASTASPATAPPVYSKEMESLLMKDLATLLAAGIIGDALLLKLVVTNIFCAVRATGTPVLNDALRLSVRVVSVVIGFLMAELPKMDVKKPGNENGQGQLPNALRLLGAVSTFSDFLRFNTRFLDELDTMLSRSDDADLCKRSAKEFLESLAKLLNHSKIQAVIHTAGGENARALTELQLQLKENVELRGFKPLSALVDAGAANKWRDDLAAANSTVPSNTQSTVTVSDQDAWKVRAWNVHSFGKFLCEDYEGNPLLYSYKGQFSTSPSVVSGISNGFSIAPPTNSSMGLFGVAPSASSNGGAGGAFSNGTSLSTKATPVDDFDDEIIVFQPSPALAPSQPHGERSNVLGGASNSLLGGGPLSSPFGSDPFSLGPNASPFGNGSQAQQQPQPLLQQRLSLSTPSSVFGSFGSTGGNASATDSSAIGSSLGYSGFQSFGNLGSGSSFGGQGAFSGQGFLSTGWGANPATTQGGAKSPVTSLAGSFASKEPQQSTTSSLRGSFFDDMDDLAAVERESALYQEKESSLSAFFGAQPTLTPSKTMSAIRSPASASMPPLPTTRSASLGGGRMAPPPGFATTTASPPGFGAAPPQPPQQQQFFTRNPFANP